MEIRIKLNTAWCSNCERVTGLQNGTCVICNGRLSKQNNHRKMKDGAMLLTCPVCAFRDYITPCGMAGYFCPDCGTKIVSLEGSL